MPIKVKASMANAASNMLSFLDPGGPVDGAFLVKRTGVILAGWTRLSVPQEVIAVMGATALGAVQTLVEGIGGPNPDEVTVKAGDWLLSLSKVDASMWLILVARSSIGVESFKRVGDDLIHKLTQSPSDTRPQVTSATVRNGAK